MSKRPWEPHHPARKSLRKPGFSGRRGRSAPAHHPRERDTTILYGWHTVKAALENPERRFQRLLLTDNARRRLAEEHVRCPVEPESVRPDDIDRLLGPEAVHQGLYAEADPLPSPDIEAVTGDLVLALDQITDPHNVGAIFRTAAAFAVSALVTTARHSPEATGVLAKSASGALEYVPHVVVQNLARGLAALREHGYLLVGLDSEGEADLAQIDIRAPLVLVVGAEGKGLRQLTRNTCDIVARLDMPGAIKSLNVSNATALALYIARSRLPLTA